MGWLTVQSKLTQKEIGLMFDFRPDAWIWPSFKNRKTYAL